jgi:hypothetical protein
VTGLSQDAGTELGKILGLTEGELALAAQKAAAHEATKRRAATDSTAGGTAHPPGGNLGEVPAFSSRAVAQTGGTVIWLIWAEAHLERISPSLLLGYALLASRRESALFLRMATGFGFAQVHKCSTQSALCCHSAVLMAHLHCGRSGSYSSVRCM